MIGPFIRIAAATRGQRSIMGAMPVGAHLEIDTDPPLPARSGTGPGER